MFQLSFDTNNAAFQDDDNGADEIARILRAVADSVDNGTTRAVIRDVNGNRVGEWRYDA